jgi:hypothetical protein
VQQDAAAFERLFAEDFVFTKMGGKLSTKAREIADASRGSLIFFRSREHFCAPIPP